jgi:hypothetical protein
MRAETESTQDLSVASRESLSDAALSDESLTDIIDQLRRRAFLSSLERRHASVPYRAVIESARLVRTSTP